MAEDEPGLAERLQAQLGPEFVIGRELGGGGMSRVFLARDTTLARDVVVKVLSPDLAAAVSVERFRREIMTVASLDHPNIVPVLRAGEVGALPYFLMPYIPGESLRARLTRGPLSVRQTTSIMKDVARALAYAHEHGVVHRDIKPDNISCRAARRRSPTSAWPRRSSRPASPARRAPQPDGRGHQHRHAALHGAGAGGGRSDGRPPRGPLRARRGGIRDAGRHAAVRRPLRGGGARGARAGDPDPIERRRYDVPRELVSLIMQCLEKEPERRPKTEPPGPRAGRQRHLGRAAGGLGPEPAPVRSAGAAWVVAVLALVLLVAWWRTTRRSAATAPAAAAPAALRPAGGSVAVTVRPTLPTTPARRRPPARSPREPHHRPEPGAGLPASLRPRGRRAEDHSTWRMCSMELVQRERTRRAVNLRFVDASRDSTMWAIAGWGRWTAYSSCRTR